MNTLNYQVSSLPANLDAERSLLGAVLLDNQAYDEAAASGLVSSDFSSDPHRRVYTAMQSLAESDRPIDLVTLPAELESRGELETIGGYPVIADLVVGATERPSIKQYVKILREKAAQRKLIHACDATVETIVEGSSSQAAIEHLGDRILQIQAGSDDAPAQHVIHFSDQTFSTWLQLAEGDGDLVGLSTGLESLDIATSGIRAGELWLIGGRTGDGKTAKALAIAAANCRKQIPVGFFSIEMSKEDLLYRLWSHEGRIPFQYIRRPRHLNAETLERVQRTMCAVGKWPLFVVEDGSLSIQKLLAKARLLIRREEVQLLIIDYVQLISAPARDEKERLTKISSALRSLAKETGVPVVAVSQLSRPKDGNQNMRPNQFSLKESGSLENDAHVIILTYRPVDDELGNRTGEDELIIAKQRHGPVGNEKVFFDSKTLTFYARPATAAD